MQVYTILLAFVPNRDPEITNIGPCRGHRLMIIHISDRTQNLVFGREGYLAWYDPMPTSTRIQGLFLLVLSAT